MRILLGQTIATAWVGAIGAGGVMCATPKPAQGEEARTLALHVVELRPYVGWADWPHSLTGGVVGGDVAYRVAPIWALQLDVAAYAQFNGGEGASPAWPLNESQASADLTFAFFPMAPIAGWGSAARGKEVGTLEPLLLGGFGLVRTRPVSVVDPVARTFTEWNNLIDFVIGIGLRAFVTRWLAIELDVRDLTYNEKRESQFVPSCPPCAPNSPNSPRNQVTWYSPDTYFTNAIQARLGASLFVGP